MALSKEADDELREHLAKIFENLPEQTRHMFVDLFAMFGDIANFVERAKAENKSDCMKEEEKNNG